MKTIFSTLLCLVILSVPSFAQVRGLDQNTHSRPDVPAANVAERRAEFISYDSRDLADAGVRTNNSYYVELDMQLMQIEMQGSQALVLSSEIDIPVIWTDRDIFLHVESLPSYYVTINSRSIAYAEDNRTPSEFLISPYLNDGINSIELVICEGTGREMEVLQNNFPEPNFFVYSQPKVRVHDFTIRAMPDSTWQYGILELDIVVANSYNSAETITVGYDIYSPQGKLQHFDMKSVNVDDNSKDTLRFREFIYGTQNNWWSPEHPALYTGMITVKRGVRMTEYIPFRIGFGETSFADNKVYRNQKELALKVSDFTHASSPEELKKMLLSLKKDGVNTIITDYPQPYWFYDICDETGIFVFDQANNNSSPQGGNRNVGGALSNDPEWLNTFLDRADAMFWRSRNHTSIIGWSIGGMCGNGYNMYKTYQLLKNYDTIRPVIFRDAGGEWNTDIASFEPLVFNSDI